MLPAPLNLNEADLEVLYRALGRGLVQWQSIEPALYLAAFGAMGVSHAACSRKFFKKTGAGGRLDLTDEALKKALRPDAYEKTWVTPEPPAYASMIAGMVALEGVRRGRRLRQDAKVMLRAA